MTTNSKQGAAVTFSFELWRVSLADPVKRRSGRGVIVGDACVGTCPAYEIRVTESPDYQPGEVVTVKTINVRRA